MRAFLNFKWEKIKFERTFFVPRVSELLTMSELVSYDRWVRHSLLAINPVVTNNLFLAIAKTTGEGDSCFQTYGSHS
jgi:hypothetical protein